MVLLNTLLLQHYLPGSPFSVYSVSCEVRTNSHVFVIAQVISSPLVCGCGLQQLGQTFKVAQNYKAVYVCV